MYKAVNRKDKNIKIALKTVKKSHYDAHELETLYRELEILSKVDNPNIVKYFENYEDEKHIYICQELCEGGDLQQKKKIFTESELIEIIPKLVRALYHCHQQNIIHRDIKPANIMYDRSGEIKLIDFGVSISQKNDQNKMEVTGTPFYIAPEVFSE